MMPRSPAVMRALWIVETAIALGILIWTIVAPAHELGAPVWSAVVFFFAVIFGDGLYRLWKAWRLIKELKR